MNNALVSINGLYHTIYTDGVNGVQVKDAVKSLNISGQNQIGWLAMTSGEIDYNGSRLLNTNDLNTLNNSISSLQSNAVLKSNLSAFLGQTQTYQSFSTTTQRISGTTYYNTTSAPIYVIITIDYRCTLLSYVNGLQIMKAGDNYTDIPSAFIVPPGASYSATFSAGYGGSIIDWVELR